MKTVIRLVLSLGMLATSLAFAAALAFTATLAFAAKTPEQAYVESYRGRTDIPVPLVVVTPEVGPGFAGDTVVLDFIVDETGRPKAITAHEPADAELVARLAAAVAQWEFAPALRAGKPAAVKVLLPFRIVDEFAPADRVAAN
jgi:hypothetical protein